jgi:hypothetical protein
MFSLAIPTCDRFDSFLSKYLEAYIGNDLIDEIIITDENGNDIDKIQNKYPNNPKLILVSNETRLGPFLNKIKACKLAKNEWIALIDSDNFADNNYFTIAKKYIEDNVNNNTKNIILAPSFAKPNFNYNQFSGTIFNNSFFKENRDIQYNSTTLMNTGNYIINKYLINNLNIEKETENIPQSPSCDVIYFNTLLFEQLDLNLHVVPNLEYEHVVHEGSTYLNNHCHFENFSRMVHNRYYKLATL